MSLISFLHDLGIVPNEGTGLEKDPNLLQGQKYMEYARLYASEVRPELKLLQVTSIPGVTSIIETLQGNDSTGAANQVTTSTVSDIENDFNKTLSEYSATHRSFSQEMLEKAQAQKNVQKYNGKVISEDGGDYSYVNDFGYTHRYSNDAWAKNASSCPTDTTDISAEDSAKLSLSGPDMGIGQACGMAGTNIKNKTTGEVAWVDIKGYKHIYSSSVWDKKDSTCDTSTTTLEGSSYDAIPSGSPMVNTTVCDKLNVNPGTWKKLSQLNDKLVSLAGQMNKELGDLTVTDNKLKQDLTGQQANLNSYITTLEEDKKNLGHFNSVYTTVGGKKESSGLILDSNKIHYLVWLILSITIVSITLHSVSTGTITRGGNVIVLIVSLIVIYIICRWLYNRMS